MSKKSRRYYKRMIIMENQEIDMNICKDIRGEINNEKSGRVNVLEVL